MADGQDLANGADPDLILLGGTALTTHPEMHPGGNAHIAFTPSNSNPGKKGLSVYQEAKTDTLQWAEKLSVSLRNLREMVHGPTM